MSRSQLRLLDLKKYKTHHVTAKYDIKMILCNVLHQYYLHHIIRILIYIESKYIVQWNVQHRPVE